MKKLLFTQFKRILIFFISGAIAATIGFLAGLPFSNRLTRWLIVGVCISMFSHSYDSSNKVNSLSPYSKLWTTRSLLGFIFTSVIGGGAVILGWYLGKLITYTMVVWPLFGAIIGITIPYQMTIFERVKKAFLGFLGGFVGIHFFPFLFFGIFPWLGLPFIAWDIEKMGLILSGGTIALGIALGDRRKER